MRRGSMAARLDRLEEEFAGAERAEGPVPTGEVHPFAAKFPMVDDEELRELAEDIRANGLLDTLVLDHEGRLVDGRNRLAACRMAGVEPQYEARNGQSAESSILSKNVKRRHLTPSQRAIAAAEHLFRQGTRAIPKNSSRRTEAGGASGAVTAAANEAGVAQAQVSRALLVLEYLPDRVPEIWAKTLTVSEAHRLAQNEQARQEQRDLDAERDARNLVRLRAAAPDLAELVDADQLPLAEALAAWQERERIEHERRQRNVTSFENATTMLWSLLRERPETLAREWLDGQLKKMTIAGLDHLQTGDGLRALARQLETLAAAVDRRGGLG